MAPKKDTDSSELKKKTIYTIKLTDEQMNALKTYCLQQLWEPFKVEYTKFAFKGNNVNVVGYESGKVVIQGKKTEEFISYVLEPQITQEIKFGYDEVLNPQFYEPHAGLDESGKGDLFGPLVSACVIADHDMVDAWLKAGLQDSKRITSDAAIFRLEKIIRNTKGVVVKTTFAKMEKYNELYAKFGQNMNSLLAWMHAKSLSSALTARRVPWAMLDQFSKQPLVQAYFKKDPIDLRMETKAEKDPVVAAASVIARAEFVRQLKALSEASGETLGKGASAQVKAQGKILVEKFGKEAFKHYAKLHFRTSMEILGLPVPEKKEWRKY
ncbi:MAG: ribonuclease HIII [Verrucomicrobia bacterium]|nr:MAG: ribonuclease HIII [Verrucomicrobiota bacterium]